MAKAAEEEMQDTMLYDGDQQRYLQLLANGGEEEVGIDASDVDSSDVASSNDIDSSDDDEDTDGRQDQLHSSVARSAGRGKRSRAAMGAYLDVPDGISSDPNPLLAEIASKSERRQAAKQRWFNDPLFAGVDETLNQAEDDLHEGKVEEDKMDDGSGDETNKPPTPRSRRGAGKGRQREQSDGTAEEGVEKLGAAAALLASMPKTDKEKRKEKRKKVKIQSAWPFSS